MQTFLTDIDFKKSAQNLDRARLGSQIYESIHILASLLKVHDKLHTPKRDVSNHPASKLWIGYEDNLFNYIEVHLEEWLSRGYNTEVNYYNLYEVCEPLCKTSVKGIPNWITKEVIETHRNCLYRKKPNFYPIEWKGEREMKYTWKEKI